MDDLTLQAACTGRLRVWWNRDFFFLPDAITQTIIRKICTVLWFWCMIEKERRKLFTCLTLYAPIKGLFFCTLIKACFSENLTPRLPLHLHPPLSSRQSSHRRGKPEQSLLRDWFNVWGSEPQHNQQVDWNNPNQRSLIPHTLPTFTIIQKSTIMQIHFPFETKKSNHFVLRSKKNFFVCDQIRNFRLYVQYVSRLLPSLNAVK